MDSELTAILIDDESAARYVLGNLLEWSTESVRIVAQADNLLDGIEAIKKHQPNVVFLDVQMPDYAGYEIVRFLDEINFEIIFVTAYDQYAIKAFEMSALDYLVKPVERSRLNQSLKKLRLNVNQKSEMTNYQVLKEVIEKKQADKIVISELHEGHIRQRIVYIHEIVAIEAQRAYSTIYLKNKEPFLVSRNLKSFEGILSGNDFFVRTHRSWLVNVSFLNSYSSNKGIVLLQNNVEAKLTKGNVPELEEAMQL
ncbi:MAG: LytTR family DNA-binding domain-containing protein [Crocinitomicaceae bacterium]